MSRSWDNYSKWEQENEDWREELAQREKEQQEELKKQEQEKKKAPITDATQNGIFGDVKLEMTAKKKKNKVAEKRKPLSQMTEKEVAKLAEYYIMKHAKEVNENWKDVDTMIEYLDMAAEEGENVVTTYYNQKFYSLLDDRDSCYFKLTGFDYNTFCQLESENERDY